MEKEQNDEIVNADGFGNCKTHGKNQQCFVGIDGAFYCKQCTIEAFEKIGINVLTDFSSEKQ